MLRNDKKEINKKNDDKYIKLNLDIKIRMN